MCLLFFYFCPLFSSVWIIILRPLAFLPLFEGHDKSPCVEKAFLLSALCASVTGTTLRSIEEREAELRAHRLKRRSTKGGTPLDTPGESGGPDLNCRLSGPESRSGLNQGRWIIYFYSSCHNSLDLPLPFPARHIERTK